MMIDWEKPIQTRDGLKARVLCVDLKCADGHGVVVAIAQRSATGEAIARIGPDQRSTCGVYAIINVPEKRTMWLNVYEDSRMVSGAGRFETKQDADDYCHGGVNRIACVEVEYKTGEGLDTSPERNDDD